MIVIHSEINWFLVQCPVRIFSVCDVLQIKDEDVKKSQKHCKWLSVSESVHRNT